MNTIENITTEKALLLFQELWNTSTTTESIPVGDSLGRILGKDYFARENIPLIRASMMDGIAVKSSYWDDGIPDTSNWELGKEFIRADTGDDFDDAFDTVIPIENVEIGKEGIGLKIEKLTEFSPGMNIKGSGSNIERNTPLFQKGHKINSTDLAVLCMGNIDEVEVIKKPIVAFIPTGSELIKVGDKLTRGKNIDSNSLMASSLLEEFGAEVVLYPITPDNTESIENLVTQALNKADMVLINGGSSKGEEDFGTRILQKSGKLYFHWSNSGPGRPVAMGNIDNKPIFIVPGPTYGCFNVLQWLIRPCILHLLGATNNQHYTTEARLKEKPDIPTKLKFLVGVELSHENGELWAKLLNFKRDGTIRCLKADGFIHSGEWLQKTEVGDKIKINLLRPY